MQLLSKGNPKISKSQKGAFDHYDYRGLTLYPDAVLCPGSKAAGCMPECLKGQGRGKRDSVTEARQAKADFFYSDPVGFLAQLKGELESFRDSCKRSGKRPAVRLNVLQDIAWEGYGVPQAFPDIAFMDYTKQARRLSLAAAPINYHLIFSWSGRHQYQKQCEIALRTDAPIAVVFRGGLPAEYLGRPVIDGDVSDIANAFAVGRVVGLRAKGTSYRDTSGFVIDNPDLIMAA